MGLMANRKSRWLEVPREWIEAEEEHLKLHPGNGILACSPPGYHDRARKGKGSAPASKPKPARR